MQLCGPIPPIPACVCPHFSSSVSISRRILSTYPARSKTETAYISADRFDLTFAPAYFCAFFRSASASASSRRSASGRRRHPASSSSPAWPHSLSYLVPSPLANSRTIRPQCRLAGRSCLGTICRCTFRISRDSATGICFISGRLGRRHRARLRGPVEKYYRACPEKETVN